MSGGMTIEKRAYLLAGAAFTVAMVLAFLAAMFRREAVKRDLSARFCNRCTIPLGSICFLASPLLGHGIPGCLP